MQLTLWCAAAAGTEYEPSEDEEGEEQPKAKKKPKLAKEDRKPSGFTKPQPVSQVHCYPIREPALPAQQRASG